MNTYHEHFELALDLLLLDGLEHLEHDELVVDRVDALKHLAVLAPTQLFSDLVLLLTAPTDRKLICFDTSGNFEAGAGVSWPAKVFSFSDPSPRSAARTIVEPLLAQLLVHVRILHTARHVGHPSVSSEHALR